MKIEKSNLFKSLSEPSIEEFKKLFSKKNFNAGQIIFSKQNYAENSFFIIETGKVELLEHNGSTIEISEGNYFSDYSFLDGKNCITEAKAINDTEVFFLEKKDFELFEKSNPEIAIEFYRISLINAFERLRNNNE